MSSEHDSLDLDASNKNVTPQIVTKYAEIEQLEAESAAFLAGFSLEEEKRILRKIDHRFLILIGLMYMIKQIDTSNAANIKVLQIGKPSNVLKELKMTANQYNWVQSSLYISYILFETPSNLLLKRISPHVWQSRILFTWGIVLACHAAIQNRSGYYAARFFLGMMEAGMFPGIICQLNSWYRSEDMGKAITWFFAIQNVAGIIGSLLAYGISYMNGVGGLSAWRWVFLLEGLATILFSGVVWFILPDYPKSPRTASWLSEREQNFVEARLSENAPRTHDKFFDKQEIIETLKSPLIWSFMLSQTLVNLGGYGLSWYLPTITTNLGFASLPRNQLLNIPPAAAAVFAIIFSGWFLKQAILTRPQYIMIIMTGMVVCFVLFFSVSSKVGIYVACILGTMFNSMYFVPFWSWRSATLRGSTGTAFTLGLQNCVAQMGGVVGPQFFQSKWAHNGYKTSFGICSAFIISAWFANIITWYLTRNVEWDVRRVARLRKQAKKEGRVFAGDDVKVFEERQFYTGFWKKSDKISGGV